jgi:hypothetical protein
MWSYALAMCCAYKYILVHTFMYTHTKVTTTFHFKSGLIRPATPGSFSTTLELSLACSFLPLSSLLDCQSGFRTVLDPIGIAGQEPLSDFIGDFRSPNEQKVTHGSEGNNDKFIFNKIFRKNNDVILFKFFFGLDGDIF